MDSPKNITNYTDYENFIKLIINLLLLYHEYFFKFSVLCIAWY